MLRLVVRDLLFYQRRNLFILPFFAILGIVMMKIGGTDAFAVAVAVISLFGFLMTAQTAFAYDEQSKCNRFLRALPIPPATLVVSRYVSCALFGLTGAALVYALAPIANLFDGVAIDIGLSAVPLCFICMSVIGSVLMPVLFRFGYMKSKYPLMLAFIAISAGMPSLLMAGGVASVARTIVAALSGPGAVLLLLAIGALALVGSVWLSISILKKKEE